MRIDLVPVIIPAQEAHSRGYPFVVRYEVNETGQDTVFRFLRAIVFPIPPDWNLANSYQAVAYVMVRCSMSSVVRRMIVMRT